MEPTGINTYGPTIALTGCVTIYPLFRVRDRGAVARRDETSPSRNGHDVSGPQGLPKTAPRRAAVDHRALPHPRPEAARPGRGMPAAAGPCRLASRVR